MRKLLSVAAIAAVAASLGACTPREERAAGGAAIGAIAGGLIGAAASGGRGGGALAGAAIGAVGGAVVADATRPRHECVRVRYDYYGNAVCTRYRRSAYYY
jgi:osmotically inducible lipoprotein OsmB